MSPGFGIALRRSNALPLAAAVLAVMVSIDILLGYRRMWEANWMKLVTGQRSDLLLMAVLAVGAGAIQAGLDHRRGIIELLASTPRSRRSRVLPVALSLAGVAVGAYLLVFAIESLWVAPYATYANPAAIAGVVGVGAVTMATSVWLGLLVGHLVPSRLTAPIVSVLTLMLMAVGSETLGHLGNGAALSLLLPFLASSLEGAATIAVRVSALQALWLLAVGLSALGAFMADRRRYRILAVLPAALVLALVAPQLPRGDGYIAAYSIDPGAAELVCATGTPRVCVTRVDAARLAQVTPVARAALAVLSRLPHPPTAVIDHPSLENTTFTPPPSTRADTVWMELSSYSADGRGRLALEDLQNLTSELLAGVGVSDGSCTDDGHSSDYYAASDIGTAWLLGRPPSLDSGRPTPDQKRILAGWQALTSMPIGQQRQRVAAMRQALLACHGDVYSILTTGSSR